MFIQLNKKGISLVEIMIVIAIATILLMVAILNLRGAAQNMEVRSAGESMQADMVLARSNALSTSSRYRINAGTNSYALEREAPAGVWSVVSTHTFDHGITITSVTGNNPLIWSPRAMPTPTGGGTFTITNRRGSTGIVEYTATGRIFVQYNML